MSCYESASYSEVYALSKYTLPIGAHRNKNSVECITQIVLTFVPMDGCCDRLSDEKSMGRRRAARTPAVSAATGGALAPLTPTDLVKHVPRTFAALWVDAASGYPSVSGVVAGSGITGDVDGGEGASAKTSGGEERAQSGSVTDRS